MTDKAPIIRHPSMEGARYLHVTYARNRWTLYTAGFGNTSAERALAERRAEEAADWLPAHCRIIIWGSRVCCGETPEEVERDAMRSLPVQGNGVLA